MSHVVHNKNTAGNSELLWRWFFSRDKCSCLWWFQYLYIIMFTWILICSTVWAWVGYGHSSNLKTVENTRKEGSPYNIIISRSHKGDVVESVKKSLGNNTNIIKAGGAGMSRPEQIIIVSLNLVVCKLKLVMVLRLA